MSGLFTYTIAGYGPLKLRAPTWLDYERLIKRAGDSGDEDLVRNLMGGHTGPLPFNSKAWIVVRSIVRKLMEPPAGALEAARESVERGAGSVAVTLPSGKVARFRVPTGAEYDAAAQHATEFEALALTLAKQNLVTIGGEGPDIAWAAMDIFDGRTYLDVFLGEAVATPADVEAALASAVYSEG